MAYYYITKSGVYEHGVFWIGTDMQEGIVELNRLSNLDSDDYHRWNLIRFTEPKDSDADEICWYPEPIYWKFKGKKGLVE